MADVHDDLIDLIQPAFVADRVGARGEEVHDAGVPEPGHDGHLGPEGREQRRGNVALHLLHRDGPAVEAPLKTAPNEPAPRHTRLSS